MRLAKLLFAGAGGGGLRKVATMAAVLFMVRAQSAEFVAPSGTPVGTPP